MTAREALDHPWLAMVKEFAAKKRAEDTLSGGNLVFVPAGASSGGGAGGEVAAPAAGSAGL